MVATTPSLRLLHTGDMHILDAEASPYIQALTALIAKKQQNESTKYHAVTTPGDLIELTTRNPGTATRSMAKIRSKLQEVIQENEHQEVLSSHEANLQTLIEKHNITPTTKKEDLKPEALAEIQATQKEQQEYLGQVQQTVIDKMIASREYTLDDILPIIEADYTAIGSKLKEIKDLGVELLAVPGNHDTRAIYQLDIENDGPLTFVDIRKEIKLVGYDGTEFTVQGDPNTYERPSDFTGLIEKLLAHDEESRIAADIFIDYNLGFCFDKANKPEYKHSSNNCIEDGTSELLASVRASQEAARTRMGDAGQADIYLTHKVTFYAGYGTGDVAAEYSKGTSTVLAGHEHSIQIGNIRGVQEFITELQVTNETAIIDDKEIPIFYFDADTPLQLNAGTNFAFEVIYNSDKKVDEIVVYELREKKTA